MNSDDDTESAPSAYWEGWRTRCLALEAAGHPSPDMERKLRGVLSVCHGWLDGVTTDPVLTMEAVCGAMGLTSRDHPRFVPGMTLVAKLPTELGAITGLRVENGSIVTSTESGVDYVIPSNMLPRDSERIP